jgi:formylglycine-generating enzyme required for sulfatase activity
VLELLETTQEKKTFGDYLVLKQIGQGSLGTVFLAEHKYLKKPFILKVLPLELSQDRIFIQRFQEEVASLASLEHPNIVKIHNISFAEGHYFLVYDCIVDSFGETTHLAKYMREKGAPLEEEEIFHILKEIGAALDYAHSKSSTHFEMAHRGIKLNNILVSKDELGQMKVTLSDFGLSRLVGVGAVLTRTYKMVAEALNLADFSQQEPQKQSSLHASFLQNFSFLAPEQKNGSSQDEAIKSDVYAFGILGYYLLTAHFPEGLFEKPSELRADLKYNWDLFLSKTVQQDPLKRVSKLLPLLEEIQKGESDSSEKDKCLKPLIRSTEIKRPETDPDPSSAFQIDTTVKFYMPEKKETTELKPLLTEMVVIKGGSFFRGSNDGNRDEWPRHQVHLNSFALDIHPVTNEQFVRFIEVMGGEKDNNYNDIIRLKDSRIKRSAGRISIESGYAKHPVVGVTWYGAVAYAKWVGKRIPTEAEWEIAASGGQESMRYPTGDMIEKTQANFFSSDTTAVMSYAPNLFGLYDMAGNVYEWVQDWYGYNYFETSVQEPDNPKGPLQGVYRVLRGGCWKSLQEDLRSSKRNRNNPGTVNSTYGFRCAADVQ